MFFYDTCALLNASFSQIIENGYFLISNLTKKELESIKTSDKKDANLKFRAKKLVQFLVEHKDLYTSIIYSYDNVLKNYSTLSDNFDSKIILTAYLYAMNHPDCDITFVTYDTSCADIAEDLAKNVQNLTVQYLSVADDDSYCGFREETFTDEDWAEFYNGGIDCKQNIYNMCINEYLILKDTDGYIKARYKWTEDGFKEVPFSYCASNMFGNIKPKDDYQACAIDSLRKNKITMIRGAAGTGKSLLALGYLFEKLEKHEIDKIIIFCNTVATAGAAKLGFYPGSKDEKLLDAQIGNFLTSKLGDKFMAERLVDDGVLLLLPLSDIRGFDSSGMKAGIYITEAQNLDIELMRLALQRIGDDSICILDGDSDAQVDLPAYAGDNNGMRRVSKVYRNDPCYGEVTLQNIYRSRIARLAQLL